MTPPRARASLAILSLIGGAVWALAPAATGQTIILSGTATNMTQQRSALGDARRQAEEARARSEKLEAMATAAGAEADKARQRAAALAARIQQSEAEIRAGQARIAILRQMQAEQAARLASKRAPAARLIAALQNVARRPSAFVLVQPGSVRDAIHVRAALATALPAIEQRSAGLRGELQRSQQLRAYAETANRVLLASRNRLASQQRDLRRLEAERRIAATGLASNASLEEERATAMGEKARDIVDLMAKLERAGDLRTRLASLPGPELRPALPGATPAPRMQAQAAPPATPPYRLPVVGTLVTGLGELSDSGVRARGLTIATAPSAQIVSPADGHVAFAGFYRGFGQIVIVDHGHGWISLIAQLARLSVSAGQNVTQGDPLGSAGVNQPRIMVELRRNGRPVDIVALVNGG